MDLWAALEQRITQSGVRVQARLELLARLKADHESGDDAVARQKQSLQNAVDEAAAKIVGALRE